MMQSTVPIGLARLIVVLKDNDRFYIKSLLLEPYYAYLFA